MQHIIFAITATATIYGYATWGGVFILPLAMLPALTVGHIALTREG